MIFFPKYFIFTLQACFKKQFFFPHYLQVYCIFVSVYGNKSQVFLKKQNRNKQKKPQTPKPFIILKLFIPTASWELLMSAGESGWYQELNIPSSLGSLWRARKAPKTTGWKKPIFLLGELVPTTMESGTLLKSNKVGHLQKFYPELTGFTFLDFVAVK